MQVYSVEFVRESISASNTFFIVQNMRRDETHGC